MGLKSRLLFGSIRFRVSPVPFLPADEAGHPDGEEFRSVWQNALARNPKLFNGRAYLALPDESNEWAVFESDYRHFLALRESPSLRGRHPLRGLAVSGVVTKGDHLLFGRRGSAVSRDAGVWELVPSGGISDESMVGGELRAEQQLLIELREETGILPSVVAQMRPFAVVDDEASATVDLAFRMELSALEPRVMPGEEYREFASVKQSELSDFLAKRSVLPVSLELLRLLS